MNRAVQADGLHEGRVPPYNGEAESAVIGAALLNNASYVIAAGVIEETHFYLETNRRVWRAMSKLHERREPIDHVTLGDELTAAGDLERIGGPMALDGLTDTVATVGNVAHYAEIVRSLAARRAMIYAAQEIVADGFSRSLETEDYLASARVAIARADRHLQGKYRTEGIGQIAHNLFSQLDKKDSPPSFVSLGFGGIKIPKGLVTVLAGRPSNGKSVVAMNAACNVAAAGGSVMVFTLEDTAEQFVARAASRYSGVPLTIINDRRIDLAEWPRVVEAFEKVARLKIYINDRTRSSSQWIRQMAALQHQEDPLDLVIIDYVQLMREKGAESRTEEISQAALGAVELARELNAAVILVSQLRRPDSTYKDRVPPPPHLDMLKGSGTLDECCRVGILLHYPHHYDEKEDDGFLWCRIAKYTNGPVGKRPMACDMKRMWVGDPDLASAADPSGGRY